MHSTTEQYNTRNTMQCDGKKMNQG